MKYTIKLDDLYPFEFTVLKYIKDTIPFKYSKKNKTITFDEETKDRIKSFRQANDGSIPEVIWNADNVNFFNKHQAMLVEAMENESFQIMEPGEDDVLHFVKSFNCFKEDKEITFKEIAQCVYTNKRKDEPGDISWNIKSMITIWAVERTMFTLQDLLYNIENNS